MLWSRLRLQFQNVARRLLLPELDAIEHEKTADVLLPAVASPEGAASEVLGLSCDLSDLQQRRWIVFSDTDNDVEPIRYGLWLAGLCNRRGHWKSTGHHVTLVHTGDWINKWDPDPYVIDFLQRLKETAPPTCKVILLNGNHEISLLCRIDAGESVPLTASDCNFIRQQEILYVEKDTLFVHGYPTHDLLSFLQQLLNEGVMDLNEFNDRFRKAFFYGKHALFRQKEGFEMLGDLPMPIAQFYAQRNAEGKRLGETASALLTRLGICRVIHGHKPNEAIQKDDELGQTVPGVRFINNDNRVKKNGLGGLLLLNEMTEVEFLNSHRLEEYGGEKLYRKRLRGLMGTNKQETSSPIPSP